MKFCFKTVQNCPRLNSTNDAIKRLWIGQIGMDDVVANCDCVLVSSVRLGGRNSKQIVLFPQSSQIIVSDYNLMNFWVNLQLILCVNIRVIGWSFGKSYGYQLVNLRQ